MLNILWSEETNCLEGVRPATCGVKLLQLLLLKAEQPGSRFKEQLVLHMGPDVQMTHAVFTKAPPYIIAAGLHGDVPVSELMQSFPQHFYTGGEGWMISEAFPPKKKGF